jgi:hypothetical protein
LNLDKVLYFFIIKQENEKKELVVKKDIEGRKRKNLSSSFYVIPFCFYVLVKFREIDRRSFLSNKILITAERLQRGLKKKRLLKAERNIIRE